MATRCSCEWHVVQIAEEVAPMLLRGRPGSACPFPHADDLPVATES